MIDWVRQNLEDALGKPLDLNSFQRTMEQMHGYIAHVAVHRRAGTTTWALAYSAYNASKHNKDVAIVVPNVTTKLGIADSLMVHTRSLRKRFNENKSKLTFINGGTVTICTPSKLIGLHCDRLIVDDPCTYSDEEMVAIINLAYTAESSTFIGVPTRTVSKLYHDLWMDSNTAAYRYPVTINPDYSDQYVDELRRRSVGSEWRHEWLAYMPYKSECSFYVAEPTNPAYRAHTVGTLNYAQLQEALVTITTGGTHV